MINSCRLRRTRKRSVLLSMVHNGSSSTEEVISLLGSPSSPPPSPNSPILNTTNIPSPSLFSQTGTCNDKVTNTAGIESTALTYNLDSKFSFELENGEKLQGEDLNRYLLDANKPLTAKVNSYHQNYLDEKDKRYTVEDEC